MNPGATKSPSLYKFPKNYFDFNANRIKLNPSWLNETGRGLILNHPPPSRRRGQSRLTLKEISTHSILGWKKCNISSGQSFSSLLTSSRRTVAAAKRSPGVQSSVKPWYTPYQRLPLISVSRCLWDKYCYIHRAHPCKVCMQSHQCFFVSSSNAWWMSAVNNPAASGLPYAGLIGYLYMPYATPKQSQWQYLQGKGSTGLCVKVGWKMGRLRPLFPPLLRGLLERMFSLKKGIMDG